MLLRKKSRWRAELEAPAHHESRIHVLISLCTCWRPYWLLQGSPEGRHVADTCNMGEEETPLIAFWRTPPSGLASADPSAGQACSSEGAPARASFCSTPRQAAAAAAAAAADPHAPRWYMAE
ncbi:unnamed protein product [Prorocentrum cordatum]|uniref:Uncharacterized protein n=1 Tax=Prorocentrum cordatum TaxID=2364126 RepID=A0ABN9W1C7_9DINO|nr:unnamed protein product [Polarella glacialis]